MTVKIKRKIEITTETEDLLIVRGRLQNINVRCDHCGAQADMVSVEQAAALTGNSLAEICRQVEEGKLHCKETKILLVCLHSLADEEMSER